MRNSSSQSGFTLIEMIVSLGVFSVVITIAMGALLGLLSANLKLQGEQGIMTNLVFAVDSMTRDIRTGTFYYCDSSNNLDVMFTPTGNLDILSTNTQDCSSSNSSNLNYHGVSFSVGGTTAGTVRRVLYYYDQSVSEAGTLMRKVGSEPPQQLVSSEIDIVDARFYVTGSRPLSDVVPDTEPPTVTITLRAVERAQPEKEFFIHTTVTQRVLDL